MSAIQFVLASQSPRRAELLQRLGYRFRIAPSDIDETRRPGEAPTAFVRRLAREKTAVLADQTLPVLGADTIVVLGDDIFGKPVDRADALSMLMRLSGSRHEVLTAVCVRDQEREHGIMTCSTVHFAPISEAIAAAYWASGESRGKAGAYAIQGLAEAFVSEVSGSYSGIVGLPLQQTMSLLKLFAIEPPALSPNE